MLAKNVRSQNIVLILPLTNAKKKYKEIQEKYEKRENLDIVYRHEDIQNIVKDIMENDIVCNMENYIYVVKEREFKNENVFKIGRTKNMKERIKHYPKNSRICCVIPCSDCVESEKNILANMKEKITREIGSEYIVEKEDELIKQIKKIII